MDYSFGRDTFFIKDGAFVGESGPLQKPIGALALLDV
jgi:hypothetical protein